MARRPEPQNRTLRDQWFGPAHRDQGTLFSMGFLGPSDVCSVRHALSDLHISKLSLKVIVAFFRWLGNLRWDVTSIPGQEQETRTRNRHYLAIGNVESSPSKPLPLLRNRYSLEKSLNGLMGKRSQRKANNSGISQIIAWTASAIGGLNSASPCGDGTLSKIGFHIGPLS